MIPERIGRYAVIRKIASGGMAEVYLCRLSGEEGFEKKVAVKVIHPRLSDEPRFRDLFVREARLAASLSHPNLVQVFDFGRVGPSYYLAMEFVEGWTLAQAMARARLLAVAVPLPVWRLWMEGMLAGIGHLHRKGIVHRDISPSNVLLSRGGLVKISDLGIARGAQDGGNESTGWEGKIAYMSPEQARGEPTGAGSDLFSVALVAAEMFLPGPVFSGAEPEETRRRLRHFDPRELDLCGAPDAVAAATRKGLASRLEERYADAEEFLRAVCNAVPVPASRPDLAAHWDALFPESGEDETLASGPPPGERAVMVRETRGIYGDRRRRRIVYGALSAFVALSAGGWVVWRNAGKETPRTGPPYAPPSPADTRGGAGDFDVSPLTVPTREVPRAPQSVPAPARMAPAPVPSAAIPQAVAREPVARPVLLETDPPGVAVGLADGTPLGRTPVHVDLGSCAGREIVFEHEGYVRKSVRAESLASLPVFRLEMERQMGALEVIQAIPWAKIYLGNRYLGETPIAALRLPVGKHRLRVVNEPLGVDKTVTVEVRPGSNPKVILPLVGQP